MRQKRTHFVVIDRDFNMVSRYDDFAGALLFCAARNANYKEDSPHKIERVTFWDRKRKKKAKGAPSR